MNMEAHINATYKRTFWEISNSGRIRLFFDEKAVDSFVHSFVSSKLTTATLSPVWTS